MADSLRLAGRFSTKRDFKTTTQIEDLPESGIASERIRMLQERRDIVPASSPVSDELGHHRILRTSPLTEVPFVCCTDC